MTTTVDDITYTPHACRYCDAMFASLDECSQHEWGCSERPRYGEDNDE